MPEDNEVVKLNRVARSLEESCAYNPDWRYKQVKQYLILDSESILENDIDFEIPFWENDDSVLRYYAYKKHGSGFSSEDSIRFSYADDAIAYNNRTGAASKIRSLVISGCSVNSIASRLYTKPEYIQTFIDLHFDIQRYMDNKDFISSLVFPFTTPKNEPAEMKKERIWKTAAFLLGVNGFDTMCHKKLDMTASDLEVMNNQLKALMYSQGLEFCLLRRSGMLPGALDLENVLSHMQIPSIVDQTKNNDSSSYIGGLIKLVSTQVINQEKEIKSIESSVAQTKKTTKQSFYNQPDDILLINDFSGDPDRNPLSLLN